MNIELKKLTKPQLIACCNEMQASRDELVAQFKDLQERHMTRLKNIYELQTTAENLNLENKSLRREASIFEISLGKCRRHSELITEAVRKRKAEVAVLRQEVDELRTKLLLQQAAPKLTWWQAFKKTWNKIC